MRCRTLTLTRRSVCRISDFETIRSVPSTCLLDDEGTSMVHNTPVLRRTGSEPSIHNMCFFICLPLERTALCSLQLARGQVRSIQRFCARTSFGLWAHEKAVFHEFH